MSARFVSPKLRIARTLLVAGSLAAFTAVPAFAQSAAPAPAAPATTAAPQVQPATPAPAADAAKKADAAAAQTKVDNKMADKKAVEKKAEAGEKHATPKKIHAKKAGDDVKLHKTSAAKPVAPERK